MMWATDRLSDSVMPGEGASLTFCFASRKAHGRCSGEYTRGWLTVNLPCPCVCHSTHPEWREVYR